MKKTELLEAFKSMKKDNGPKKVTNLANKDVLIKAMKGKITEKTDKKEEIISVISDNYKAKLESEWKPTRTSVRDLSQRFLMEAELTGKRQPNAFRLNLQPIVMNNTHAKFSATRADKSAIVELLYPNANGKISVKIQVDGADDKLVEVGLEDKAYRLNFGEYIIHLIDETIADSRNAEKSLLNNYMYGDNETPEKPNSEAPMGTVNDRGSNSVLPVGGPTWESDRRTMNALISIIEADDKLKVEDDTAGADADAGDADISDADIADIAGGDQGDAGDKGDAGDASGFGEEDFAIDAGADTKTSDTFGDDFGFGGGGGGGASGGLGDIGGLGGEGDDKKGSDINAEGGPSGEETEFLTFRDKTDWLQSSLDTMQNLIAQSMGQKMQEGKGVILTSDEIMNGTAGMRNVDKPVDIVDKFLKIYPELDETDLTVENLEQIEQKLSLNDNQFDAWLAQKLPEFRGEDEVNETLSNEMFDDFKPMGGEEQPTSAPEKPSMDGDFMDFLDKTAPTETETPAERKEAEIELGLPPTTNEFTEIGQGEPEGEPEKEEETEEPKK